MASAPVQYLPGKEPHPRETRLIFRNVDRADYDPSIDCYMRDGGYEQLKAALKMEKSAIINEVKASGLRGRGGPRTPCLLPPQLWRNKGLAQIHLRF